MSRKRSKKKNKVASIDIEVIVLIISSIISAILIYGNQGNIGQTLNNVLGGIIGWIKYLVPIALFLMAIYLVCEDKEYMTKKFFQKSALVLTHQFSLNFKLSWKTCNIFPCSAKPTTKKKSSRCSTSSTWRTR